MKKWVVSAMVYLLVVIGAYYAIASFIGVEPEDADHNKNEQHDN